MPNQRGNIIIVIAVVLLLLISFAFVGFMYLQQPWQEQKDKSNLTSQSVTLSPTKSPVSDDNFHDIANRFFLAAKTKNLDTLYSYFSTDFKATVSKDKVTNLLNGLEEMDLPDAQSLSQTSIKDVTLTSSNKEQKPGKSYVGLITYSTPPNGNLEITFMKEGNNWGIEKFNFIRQTIANSGNLEADLTKIKESALFKIYKPVFLPSGYIYDGAVTLELTNSNLPDEKFHQIEMLTFSNNNSETPQGGSEQTLITQTEYKTTYAEMFNFLKKQSSINGQIKELSASGGKVMYYQVLGLQVLVLVKTDSIISVEGDSSLTTTDLLKVINSFVEVK